MTTAEAREAYYKQMWEIATAKVRELMASERAVDILRSACSEQEGIPLNEQSTEPEDMALWAVTKIARLEKELSEK